ncbi:alpha/beta fold hydrolase [Aliamphritea spongicola]|uniref:alpha/beta fold hydrolase n=1 Tax=Aliamphritea spongicola TaxID=707589 RepID=UPI00196ADEA6|nr:alpha/beta fold hydrolase [Aliamphritea spongicola]MBN3564520.1 alpha/beta fold hydrolase [Aliamphritea spongicola]
MKLHLSYAGQPLHQAPTLVLLHGWGMHSEIWQPLCTLLEDDFSLVLIDLPGHGLSKGDAENCTLKGMVTEIHNELLKAGISQAAWLGWSLGGIVAMAYAQSYRDNVTSLMTLCTSPCFVVREDWAAGMDTDTFAQFSDAFKTHPQKTLQRFAMLQVQGSETARQDLKQLKSLISSVSDPDYPAVSTALEILEADYRALYCAADQSDLPVSHFLCEHDTLAPASVAEYLRQLSGSAMAVLAGSSHVPMLSDPQMLAARIKESLK